MMAKLVELAAHGMCERTKARAAEASAQQDAERLPQFLYLLVGMS